MHCMSVTLRHDGAQVTGIDADMARAPWTTCPGARDQLVRTFAGLPLEEVHSRRDKRGNCTHLHDLAVLAATHACSLAPGEGLDYEILVSDPQQGERRAEIRRQGNAVHVWVERDGVLCEPSEIAGLGLFALRDWIAGLPDPAREAARLLQWGAIMAHGRILPYEDQSDASRMPPNCYTFQPERSVHARRVGQVFDFSDGTRVPLASSPDDADAGMSKPA